MDKREKLWYTSYRLQKYYKIAKEEAEMSSIFGIRRLKRLFLCCLLLVFVFSNTSALALSSAPMTTGASRSGMVRVYLSSLGSPTTVQATINGSYSLDGKALANGSKITVKINSITGTLTCSSGGNTASMGNSFTLRRHEASGENGVRIAQSREPANLYPGDVTFTAKSSGAGYKLYVIVTVFMEDYLYGVLPYEMGNSSGLEALKAQAVAARTYTLRAMNSAANALYDVVDTTADQTYSGTPGGNQNCKNAVDKTRGIVLQNGSELTATYYTSSNGGQAESLKNIWGSSAYPYLAVKDDPYDLNSPDAKKVSFTVRSSGSQSGTLQNLLNRKAENTFGAGSVVIGVTAMRAHTPKYPSPSRLYTKLDFTVQYTRNGQTDSGKLTFDIFSELESPLGMSINSDKNELWSVTQTSSGFTVTARRYGHGLGMSQRGAMYMAAQGHSYDEILAFYYTGCTRVQYELTRSILSPVTGGESAQVQVTPVAPAPIENPETALDTARVTTPNGTLNLRAGASQSSAILRTIPQNAVIPIYQNDGTWCRTSYEGTDGYVMRSFLTFSGDAPVSTPSGPENGVQAQVTTSSGPLNCRESAGTGARILTAIPRLQAVTVLSESSGWSKVRYNGIVGYVMSSYLTLLDGTPSSLSSPSSPEMPTSGVYAKVTTSSGSLNLRQNTSTSAAILSTIPRNEIILILEKGADWCKTAYSGNTGYVMTKFLNFGLPAAPDTPTPSVPAVQAPGAIYARVTTASGSLNLRRKASENADVLCTIPQNEVIPLEEQGNKWCRVNYQNMTGYVMNKFLTILGSEEPAQPASPFPVSVRVRDNIGSLNLRVGPSVQSRIILEIPENEYVLMTEAGETWCVVTYLGHSGYCMRQYLEWDE